MTYGMTFLLELKSLIVAQNFQLKNLLLLDMHSGSNSTLMSLPIELHLFITILKNLSVLTIVLWMA